MTKKIEITEPQKQITVNSETKVVNVLIPGPQGAKGLDLDDTNRVDGSLVKFSSSAQKYIADTTTTDLELTDGGNF
tara:strand:+ start:464 stop:691 length:228 start_codon:yes stop_codon:yes gene_type:complete